MCNLLPWSLGTGYSHHSDRLTSLAHLGANDVVTCRYRNTRIERVHDVWSGDDAQDVLIECEVSQCEVVVGRLANGKEALLQWHRRERQACSASASASSLDHGRPPSNNSACIG